MPKKQLEQNETENEQKLIKAAIQGDKSAFGQVYDTYFEKIYRFILYRVSHKQTAEDLVAEVFIRCWDKRETVEKMRSFEAWIYQIARNIVIDHYRSRKQTVDIDQLKNVIEDETDIVETLDLDFDQKRILKYLRHLTDDQQDVIRLKFIEDLENAEIAEILEKTEGAIRVLQHRAIKELKDLIEQHEE